MLERKIMARLGEWKKSGSKAALLVKGARQVGKTTSIREFGKSYRNYVEINFERTPSARKAFDGDLDARTVILNLSAQGYGPFEEGETLVFFDEVQSCPNARAAIKFLVEDGRFDFIESGSLLGINYRDVPSYPVGFEEQVDMFPLDFEEFLWANGVSRDVVSLLRDSYENLRPVPGAAHESVFDLYRKHMIVGGMPSAVTAFLENDDLSRTIRVQNMLLANYRDDISKYAGREKDKAKAVLDAVPEQLGKRNKRFILASLDENASRRKYEQATNWLIDAGIAAHCFNVTDLSVPLSFSEKRNLYKLYMMDTGLLCAMTMSGAQAALLAGDIRINEGMFAENAVASELAKRGVPLRYFSRKTRDELDFVMSDGGKVTVIEVKSGDDYRKHRALDNVASDARSSIARKIVLCKSNVEVVDDVEYLPLYMGMFL